jgi:hypothetical protein
VKIGAGGGVEAIVKAMGGHRGSEGVQRRGCWALKNLAANNADKVVKMGGGGGHRAGDGQAPRE